jgi:hypothetical protein
LSIGTTGSTGITVGTMAGIGTGVDFNDFLSSAANYLALISGGSGFKLLTFFSNTEKSPKGFG